MLEKVSICITRELLFRIKKDTNNISKFFQECGEEKIKDNNATTLLQLIDNFPRVSIEENTTDLLRRYRNEE